MAIELRPETEALIRQDVGRGPYRDAAEFVELAVALLHQQEEWLSAHREEIAAAIEAGYVSAQNGDLNDGEEVRKRMAARKQEWLAGLRTPA